MGSGEKEMLNQQKPALCHPERKHYATGKCRPCYAKSWLTPEYQQRWRAANPEKNRAYVLKWKTHHLEKAHAIERDCRLRREYGITTAQYELMLASQGGVCALCHELPKNRRLSVDHNHTTNQVRALLCWFCNYLVGILETAPDQLERAAEYIRNYVYDQTA